MNLGSEDPKTRRKTGRNRDRNCGCESGREAQVPPPLTTVRAAAIASVRAAVLSTLLITGLGAVNTRPAGAETLEHWYRLALGDAPAGWMMVRERHDDARRTTETQTQLKVARGGTEVQLEMASRFVESADGRPIEAWSRQMLGPQPIESTYTFDGDTVRVETVQGTRRSVRQQPAPEDPWLPPAAAQDALRAGLRRGDTRLVVRSLDPLLGLTVMETEWLRLAEHSVTEVPAGSFATSRWQQRVDRMPGLVATIELDGEGTMVMSTTPFMDTTMTLRLADRQTAVARTGAPEMMVGSFIQPDRPIDHPRALRRAVYRLRGTRPKSGDGAPLALPSLGVQQATIEDATQGTAAATRIAIDLDHPQPASAEPPAAVYRSASTYLDYQTPELEALIARATAGLDHDASSATRAETLRRFVGGYLENKDLDSLLATASEAADSHSGDCTEHSVLLAALLRGEGIASRVAAGLIYVEDFAGHKDRFAYHMWTQAYLDGRWIDLDATTKEPFDAAHIALATSALGDDQAALVDLAAILPLIGSVRIEVVEAETAEAP